jgi:hypothetical protein
MVHGNVPLAAIKIVQDMQSRGLPVAQNGGVLALASAGLLKGRNDSIGDGMEAYVPDGVFKGVAVVQDGDILTSGTRSFSARREGRVPARGVAPDGASRSRSALPIAP